MARKTGLDVSKTPSLWKILRSYWGRRYQIPITTVSYADGKYALLLLWKLQYMLSVHFSGSLVVYNGEATLESTCTKHQSVSIKEELWILMTHLPCFITKARGYIPKVGEKSRVVFTPKLGSSCKIAGDFIPIQHTGLTPILLKMKEILDRYIRYGPNDTTIQISSKFFNTLCKLTDGALNMA